MNNYKKFTLLASITMIFSIIIGLFLFIPKNKGCYAANDYRALYVMDYNTGTVIKQENENERYPIASMVKIMTLLLAFEEIDANRLTLDEKVLVSDYAAGMGGSQLFLDAGKQYPVTDLLKGVTVCSANDAAVALGERISGSNDEFVNKMNKKAKELGMNNTLFCNATGLPDSGEQYSTAKDVSIMMRELLTHPKYYDYTKITLEDYIHPDGRKTQMVNTNKLIRAYAGCDAGKTGFTNEAMFCLSASAKKGDTRVIVTVLGCPDSKTRFRKVSENFSSAFSEYETRVFLKKGDKIPCEIVIDNGKSNIEEAICENDICVFGKRGELENYSLSVTFFDNLLAPLSQNSPIGKVSLLSESGQEIAFSSLYPSNNVEKKNFADNFRHVIDHWKIIKD